MSLLAPSPIISTLDIFWGGAGAHLYDVGWDKHSSKMRPGIQAQILALVPGTCPWAGDYPLVFSATR